MQQALLKQFKAHRAQMRTQYDLDELATLTLQVYERGLDAWSPIVAAAHEDEYHIISGHRQTRGRNHHRSGPCHDPVAGRVSGFAG